MKTIDNNLKDIFNGLYIIVGPLIYQGSYNVLLYYFIIYTVVKEENVNHNFICPSVYILYQNFAINLHLQNLLTKGVNIWPSLQSKTKSKKDIQLFSNFKKFSQKIYTFYASDLHFLQP